METPAFVVDTLALTRNALILKNIKEKTGCRILLALKAFSMPSAFEWLQPVLDGTCASSVHEAKLGHDFFGGETHAFAAAFTKTQMQELIDIGINHITFNSFAQYKLFRSLPNSEKIICGLRINPEHSEGEVALYDPCAPKSRLGIKKEAFKGENLDGITGLHCHNLCEQNADAFVRTLAAIEEKFGDVLGKMKWINFGGGHHLTRCDYDTNLMINTLNSFVERYPDLQIYLEPGEACVLNAGTLVATVLDIIENSGQIAILDASCACHTPDVMEMPYLPRIFRQADWSGAASPDSSADCGGKPDEKPYTYRLTGPSCLAGDVFGDYSFNEPLKVGDQIIFEDMALYTMVKTNTFNGINLPNIVLRTAPNEFNLVRSFGYNDFISRL